MAKDAASLLEISKETAKRQAHLARISSNWEPIYALLRKHAEAHAKEVAIIPLNKIHKATRKFDLNKEDIIGLAELHGITARTWEDGEYTMHIVFDWSAGNKIVEDNNGNQS